MLFNEKEKIIMYDLKKDNDGWLPFTYEALIDSFEMDVKVAVDADDYQGDSLYVLRDGTKYGYLCFGWGSCSGCDALEACRDGSNPLQDMTELRDELFDSIVWFDSLTELQTWVANRDWQGTWMDKRLVRDFQAAVQQL
jgi:hypothetical protein